MKDPDAQDFINHAINYLQGSRKTEDQHLASTLTIVMALYDIGAIDVLLLDLQRKAERLLAALSE